MPKPIISDIIKIKRPEIEKPKKAENLELPRKVKEKKGGFWRKLLLWTVLTIILLLIINAIIGFLAYVSINITPKQEFVNIDLNLKTQTEIMQIEHEESQTVMATGVETGGQKASGQIVIYNAYSSVSQTLIKNTRFETPDGKIYRTNEKVTVPGNGSLEVTVYADEPGEAYNIGLTDFTIPGFKGDPRYEKIYARSKTKMSGGFSGTSSVLAKEDAENAVNNLRDKIKNYLTENILKQKPEEYLFFEKGIAITFDENLDNPKEGDMGKEFNFIQKGIGTGFLLKENELSEEVAKRYLNEETSKEVRIANLDKLEFNLLNHNEDNTEITFNLKGRAHFVWKVDIDSLFSDLTTAESENYSSVFKKYPTIESAEIIFSPSWWRKIPQNRSKAHFEEILKSE